ncbi:LysR family transcriptional regulator [Aquicoccus sp. G2-2]|uniref:LysR family transcriptional regulator n=1 Tax=Aquicoccus sp. G2-2 TaxID=3092120 RepID=UPI002AE04F25|nr:LysR family transcriptional regulator [Aquicoccus sp. G2-2]MEA1114789.1 LysR family transcriptional regulator [Aquicoccus sp. G2-2]
MSLDDMNVFYYVAKHGSFTSAARALGRPKSSVSIAVSRLEARLGLRLLERTTRRIRVTEVGMNLVEECAQHLVALEAVTETIQSQRRTVSGTLRLAAPYEFGAHHLARVAAGLMSKHEGLNVVLDVQHHTLDIFERDFDIVFSMTDSELPNSSAISKRVFTLKRGLFASPELLERHSVLKKPSDLCGMPLLCGADDILWRFYDRSVDRNPIDISIAKPRMISANAGVRKIAALQGTGVARITTTYCADEVRSGELIPLLPDFECQALKVYALMPARRLMLPKVRAFLDSLN